MALTKAITHNGMAVPNAYFSISDWVASKSLDYLNIQVVTYTDATKAFVLYSKVYEHKYEVPTGADILPWLYARLMQHEDFSGAASA